MTANNTKPCDPPPISEILNELCSSGEMPELLSPLPDEQRQAIVLLLTQGIKATASALGLSKMTIYRWRSQPDFRRAYLTLQRIAFDSVYTDVAEIRRRNREVLESIRDDETQPTKARIGAVKLLEDIISNTLELQLDERVAALERSTRSLALHRDRLRSMSTEELVEYMRRLASDDPNDTDD